MVGNSKEFLILHDFFESVDGGGRLCLSLAESMKADLAYGFRVSDHPYFLEYHPANCIDLRAYSSIPLWKQYKVSRRFLNRTRFAADYLNAIYSGSYSPLSVLQHPAKRNILYCHTPPRFLYDKKNHYLDSLPHWKRNLLQQFISYLKPRYEAAVDQMDVVIANSVVVKKRIEQYLGRVATVVHPPCETSRFKWQGQNNYYLSTARLDALKQVDRCIQAFLKLPQHKLVVTSEGVELAKLKKLAANAPNIIFTGRVSESKLAELIGNAIATIYLPADEDFGMSPVESMSAGKPVIAVAAGGLEETVVHEHTGLLLRPDFGLEELVSAIQIMTPAQAMKMRRSCEQRAQRFSRDQFNHNMYSLLRHY